MTRRDRTPDRWQQEAQALVEATDYRAYVLDKSDRIIARHDFKADSTSAALEHSRQYVDGHDLEAWQHTHIIGRLKRQDVIR